MAARCRLVGLLFVASLLVPPHASAQVQRCVGAGGQVIFTDRSCQSIGADDWRTPAATDAAPASSGATITSALACPRTVRDLAAELAAAIQASDTDHLSALYDWIGVSRAQQPGVLSQLDALARRPLAGLEPILADPPPANAPPGVASMPPPAPAAADPATAASPAMQQVTTAVGTVTWAPAPPAAAPRAEGGRAPVNAPATATAAAPASAVPSASPSPPRVVGIRVLQSAPDGIRAVNTPLSLVRRWGCWWLRFQGTSEQFRGSGRP